MEGNTKRNANFIRRVDTRWVSGRAVIARWVSNARLQWQLLCGAWWGGIFRLSSQLKLIARALSQCAARTRTRKENGAATSQIASNVFPSENVVHVRDFWLGFQRGTISLALPPATMQCLSSERREFPQLGVRTPLRNRDASMHSRGCSEISVVFFLSGFKLPFLE